MLPTQGAISGIPAMPILHAGPVDVKFKNCDVNFGKSDNPLVATDPLFHCGRADSGHVEANDVPAQILAVDVGERG
jgi:hypothetical protein